MADAWASSARSAGRSASAITPSPIRLAVDSRPAYSSSDTVLTRSSSDSGLPSALFVSSYTRDPGGASGSRSRTTVQISRTTAAVWSATSVLAEFARYLANTALQRGSSSVMSELIPSSWPITPADSGVARSAITSDGSSRASALATRSVARSRMNGVSSAIARGVNARLTALRSSGCSGASTRTNQRDSTDRT